MLAQQVTTAQRRQKDYYDARSSTPRFAIGDYVRLHSPAMKPGQTKKFYLPWKGPYKVLEVIDDVVYRIENCATGKLQVVHMNRLKPSGSPGSELEVSDFVPLPEATVDFYHDELIQNRTAPAHNLRDRAQLRLPRHFQPYFIPRRFRRRR